jgi:hypothetical protein
MKNNMYNFEEVKEFIKKKKYQDKKWQVYNTYNTVGDPTKKVYDKDGVEIRQCSSMGYIEVIGITPEEYATLHGPKYHILNIQED